jgi:hypothetical protein
MNYEWIYGNAESLLEMDEKIPSSHVWIYAEKDECIKWIVNCAMKDFHLNNASSPFVIHDLSHDEYESNKYF